MSGPFGATGRVCKALILFFSGCASLLALLPTAFAVMANPEPFEALQPDGTRVTLRVRGDEHFNWSEDLAGYTVLENNGWLEYARLNPQGQLVPTGLKVGLNNPKANGLARGQLPSTAQRAPFKKGGGGGGEENVPPVGTIRNLVVLIQFSNHTGRALPSTSQINVLFNQVGGDPSLAPTGSVRDVYHQNSYGQMTLESDIAAWVTVSQSEQYYANGVSGDSTLWQALREALDEVDQAVNFSQYDSNGDGFIDSITFLHSGYGAEWGGTDADGTYYSNRIWSHRWTMQGPWTSSEGVSVGNYHISPALWSTSGSNIGRIGVIAHETGHFFGLPDLYDTDGGGSGIGSYGLMANSWGFDNSQRCPPHFSPWSKVQLGWVTPQTISQAGQYSLAQSATNDDYVKISSGYSSGEYLMIENRQQAGFDCSLPQGGLAIWHIDENAGLNTQGYPGSGNWPQNGQHYRVALAQADGNFQLEKGHNRGDAGDLHHGAGVDAIGPGPGGHPNTDGYKNGQITVTGHTISDISVSGAVMSFCLNGCGGGGGGGGYDAPTNLSASVSTTGRGKSAVKHVDLDWADNSNGADNEDVFVIERCQESGKGKTKTCNFAAYATVGQDVNSFSDSPGSGTFKYRVRARRGNSDYTAYSNEVQI